MLLHVVLFYYSFIGNGMVVCNVGSLDNKKALHFLIAKQPILAMLQNLRGKEPLNGVLMKSELLRHASGELVLPNSLFAGSSHQWQSS